MPSPKSMPLRMMTMYKPGPKKADPKKEPKKAPQKSVAKRKR